MERLLKLKDRIVAKIFKILTLDFIFPWVYRKAARKPLDPNKVVFVEVRLPAVTNSFKVIFDEIVSKYDFTVHTHFLRNNAERKNIYLRRCTDMLRDIATAKYVFMNEASNCIGSVKLRPETKITQLWHGCGAFKKFGLSTADLIFGDTRKEQLKHPYYENYSLVTVSSPEVAWAYEEAMNLSSRKEIIKATGSSRTDVFYDEEFIKSAYETLYDIVPQARGKKVILYAPTFRGRVARAQTSKMFNIEMFYENFSDEYIVLFKHHPLVQKLPVIPHEFSDFAIDVTRLMDIEDLLCVSDICITDYSSLVFEYSLFEKPIIFFAFDLDTYFDWRGFYYDYFEMSPGPVCSTNLEMIDYIKNIDTRFDKQRVKDFRYKFMRSCDGNATKRILEEVVGKDELEKHKKENPVVLPYNLVPTCNGYYRNYLAKLKSLKKEKNALRSEYKKYMNEEIVPKKAVLLNCSKELKAAVKVYCPDIISVRTSKTDTKKNNEAIKEIATAEYVFVEKDNSFLDMLTLKDETKVVYIPLVGMPFRKFGKATLRYKSEFFKDKYAIAPKNNKVDIVSSASELYNDIYCESLGVDKNAFIYSGDVKSDCFFNNKYAAKVKKKLFKTTGDIGNKKILLDLVVRDDAISPVPDYEAECDNYLYEYLNKDYIILKYFVNNSGKKLQLLENQYSPTMRSYVKGIFDVTYLLNEYEAIAVADVVIGSFSDSFFTSFAAGKPVFAFTPFCRRRLHNLQTNFKYEAILPCPSFTEPKELVNAILDVKNYDYSKINKFKDTFICNNDGKSTERLLVKLGLIK